MEGKITNRKEHWEMAWFLVDEVRNMHLGRVARRVIENNLKNFLP